MLDLEALLSDTKELPPCGPDLEHDLSYFELEEAARGKPEQRIGDTVKPGEDPKWATVSELACGLLLRSKDLRIAVHLTRALTRTDGLPGLAEGLGLVAGLLNRHWDDVHPRLEEDPGGGDPTARVNALAPLADPQCLIKDLRDTYLVNSREHGQIQARDVEVALGRLVPLRGGDPGALKPLNQIHAQIAAALASDNAVPTALRAAREHVLAIQALMADRIGSDRATDLKPLVQSIESLLEVCDGALGGRQAAERDAGAAGADVSGQAANGAVPVVGGEIRNREQAVRVLDLVCAYLERHEPSHPAPLFIRRAQRLMQKNFVEIVQDLLPDSLSNLERLAGELEKK
jgi:type VI secretion system protein ImpA